jgi:2-polyprenyl-3-methyl-5-hydroxy-6-metoxy-1,4-benzoquinol methylase
MTVKSPNCLICDSKEYMPFLQVPNRFDVLESFMLVRCSTCGFVYLWPRPVKMEKYYEDAGYQPHQEKAETFTDRLYRWVRVWNLKIKEHLIEKYQKKGKVLDYGCGTGTFLSHMQKAGWDVQGVEPSKKARSVGIQNGLNLQTKIDQISGSFDVITLWHVLEHIANAHEVIDNLSKKLTSQGILVIAVPNRDSLDAKIYKSCWVAYDVPRHLYHFRPQDMIRFLERCHLQIVSKRPLFFDTWFNVLLSWQTESVLSGKQFNVFGLMKAGCVAFSTFLKELFCISSSSSLVYVVKSKL